MKKIIIALVLMLFVFPLYAADREDCSLIGASNVQKIRNCHLNNIVIAIDDLRVASMEPEPQIIDHRIEYAPGNSDAHFTLSLPDNGIGANLRNIARVGDTMGISFSVEGECAQCECDVTSSGNSIAEINFIDVTTQTFNSSVTIPDMPGTLVDINLECNTIFSPTRIIDVRQEIVIEAVE